MKFNLLHPRDQIVHIMNRIYNNGMTTLSGGNLSIRDDNGDIWITPTGIDKGKLQSSDIMCVKQDGTVIGENKVSSEYPFQRWIYKKRPDLNAIADHKLNTRTIPKSYVVLRDIQLIPYGQQYKEPNKIAEIISNKNPVLLIKNECILIAGGIILEVFNRLEVAEFTPRSIIDAQSIGSLLPIGKDEVDQLNVHFLGSN